MVMVGSYPSSGQAVTERFYNCPQSQPPHPGSLGGIKEAGPHHALCLCHGIALSLGIESTKFQPSINLPHK
jgi:hypothetical protein